MRVMAGKHGKGKYDRLVGALGGGGGALALGTLLSYIIWPRSWFWQTALTFEVIGIFMIIMSVFFHLKGLIEDVAEKIGEQKIKPPP